MTKSITALVLIAVGAFSSGCVSTEISPPFRLQLVNEEGRPLPGLVVAQFWQHYGLEFNEHSERFTTDNDGVVDIPRRTITKNIVSRSAWFIFGKIMFWHPHLSLDLYMYVVVKGHPGNSFSYEHGQEDSNTKIPNKIIMSSSPPP